MTKRITHHIDPDELKWQVRELFLVIDSEEKYYNRKVAMFKNLYLKLKKGRFDRSRAPKMFSYLTDEVGRDYNKHFGKGSYNISISARRMADMELVEEFLTAVRNKDYDFMR